MIRKRHHGAARIFFLVLLLAVMLAIGAMLAFKFIGRTAKLTATADKSRITSQPAMPEPSTRPSPPPPPKATASYLQVVRAAYPDFPATQPLDVPLDMAQAAHLVMHDPG